MEAKILFALLALAPAALRAVEVDGIAARVGSATILKSDILREMERIGAVQEAYADVRNHMIERELVLKAASDAKMTMQEWLVDNRIREILARNFDGDRNKLVEALGRQKMSYPEWRNRMKDDMIVSAMRWQIVDKNVTASPAAMREEYEKHPERYVEGRKTTVSVILLGPKDLDKKAEVEEALKSEPFGEVAKKYSSDTHAGDGGQWKNVDPEEVFRPEICAELDKMPKGTVSGWIELDGWSFLLRKDDETGGAALSFGQAYDKIAANVKERAAEKLYTEWLDLLKSETYIKIY